MVHSTNKIQWYKNNSVITGASDSSYRVTSSGSYYALLKNADGCILSTSEKAIVIDKAKPPINYPVKYAVTDLPLNLKARQIGATVLWNPLNSLNDAKSFTPVFQGARETLYTIKITTATECVTVDTQLVKIVKNVEIYVPNAFTPNGDGKNDLLRPQLRGILELHYFKIYNRWGQLVFETQIEEAGWNGTIKGTPQSTQTVIWILQGIGVDNVIYTKKGTATLIR
jgi:gliding motility-associated-like protein